MAGIRKPSVVLLIARVVILTVLSTLAVFAIALFLSIVAIVIANLIRGGGVDVTYAYRHIAVPVAAMALLVAFGAALAHEVRTYRRDRAAARGLSRAA